MGEVYRARDTELDRTVALKVLPDDLVRDAERLARFEREAKVLASLNHPSIASIFGIERMDGHPALVLELAAGKPLSDRIRQGPCPIEDAITIAREIADALEAAHARGIVHRDLKPDNVLLSDGKVKVLDFGLATILAPVSGTQATAPAAVQGLTISGVIMGTPGYMAPEQAMGQPADKRADIWSFGVILWELLTGSRMFRGRDYMETHAVLLHAEIDLNAVPANTPPALRRLLERTLQRDRNLRLHDIADARLELDDALEELRAGPAVAASTVAAPPDTGANLRRTVLIAAGVIAVGIVLATFLLRSPARTEAPASPVVRSELPLPDGIHLDGWGSPIVALSRDGRYLAYVARKETESPFAYLHDLAEGTTIRIPDSETAEGPFFSPDGRSVGFAVGTSLMGVHEPQLRRYAIESGITQTVCKGLDDYFGGTWADDGTIYFVNESASGLYAVPSSGGEPRQVIGSFRIGDRDSVKRVLGWPQILPDQRYVIATDWTVSSDAQAVLIDLETGTLKEVVIHAFFARYVPTGHLVYVKRDQSLMTVAFDPSSGSTVGEPAARLRGVTSSGNGGSVLAMSDNGLLAYTTGYLRRSLRELFRVVRISEDGKVEPTRIEPAEFSRVISASPDGRRIAACTWDGSVWVYDLARGTRVRVYEGQSSEYAIWSNDGSRIAFVDRDPEDAVTIVRSDGSGEAERVLQPPAEVYVHAFMPGDDELLISSFSMTTGIYALAIDGSQERRPIVMDGIWPAVSPDGTLLAYVGIESANLVPRVRRLDASGPGVSIATQNNRNLNWSHDGRELYLGGVKGLDAVTVGPGPGSELDVGEPRRILDHPELRAYDLLPGGRKFIALERVPGSGIQTRLTLVSNWFRELEATGR